MTEHPNLAAARAGYEAFATGDMAAIGELVADDIIWHVPGDNSLSGDYLGKEAVFNMFGRLRQETDGTFKNEIHDILANDDHGVALVTTTLTRNGESFSDQSVHVFHMSDGKMTEFWNFPRNQRVIDNAWA